jgi:hypothetical protein
VHSHDTSILKSWYAHHCGTGQVASHTSLLSFAQCKVKMQDPMLKNLELQDDNRVVESRGSD